VHFRLTVALVVACCGAASAAARPAPAAPGPPIPVLVELFTSEGCSSCPPADQLLRELIANQPASARIIALSEHVDYWNDLGWTDPFSAKLFTDRQTAYGKSLGVDVYTPQVVIDGRRAVIGSSRSQVAGAILNSAQKPAIRLTWTSADHATLEVTVPDGAATADATVFLAVTEDHLQNSVSRGENKGLKLAHDAVTRRLTEIGTTGQRGGFHRVVPVAEMLDRVWKPAGLHVVVFVQNRAGVAAVETLAFR
jgi:hypothetical protein